MKKTWVRKTLSVGVLAAGALLLAPAAAALADTDQPGLGSLGALTGGIPVSVPAELPLDPCGNVLGILGAATGVCAEDVASAQPIESGTIKPSRKQIETRSARHDKKRTESGSTFFPGLGGLGGFYGGGGCGSSYAVFGYSSGFGGCSTTIVHRKRTKWVKRVVPVYTPGYVIGGSDCGNWNVHRASAIYGVVGAYDYDDYGTCGGDDYDAFGYDVISNGYGYGYGYVAGCGIPVGYVNGGACGTGVGYPNGGGYANPAAPVGPGTTGVPGNTGVPGTTGVPGNSTVPGNTGIPGGTTTPVVDNPATTTPAPGDNGGFANPSNVPGDKVDKPGKPSKTVKDCKDKADKADKDCKKPSKSKGKDKNPVRGNPDGYGDVDDSGYKTGGGREYPADVQEDNYGAQGGGRSAEKVLLNSLY